MIGLFDSGIGGFSVLSPLLERMPDLSFIYLADTAHLPYSNKSPQELKILVGKILRYFEGEKVDGLVFACNTSSALVLPDVKGRFPVAVFGVVEPGIAAALAATQGKGIGVAANEVTAKSGVFGRLIRAQNSLVPVIEHGCPKLVSLVEQGDLQSENAKQAVRECCEPFAGKIDALILGCTHFPFLSPLFEEALPGVRLINPAIPLADELAAYLQEKAKMEQSPRRRLVSTGIATHLSMWVRSVLKMNLLTENISLDEFKPWIAGVPIGEKSGT